ncbi:MAG: hypothetical protein AABY15_06760 [Nanoarchaeota archaeon]
MGRTITTNFKREGNTKFSDKEIEAIVGVVNKYNSGKLADVWHCDSFYPKPIDHIVDWNGKKGFETKMILRQQLGDGDGYTWANYIDQKIEQLMKGKEIKIGEKCPRPFVYNSEKKVYTRVAATKLLVKEGWISFMTDNIGGEFHEFIKVQGNEFNAMLVFLACKEISILVPKAEIYIKDEGEFLLCPIRMCNGKAVPVLEAMYEQMQHLALKMLFSKGFEGNILDKLVHKPEEFTHEFRMDFNLDNTYGDMTTYINHVIRNLKEIENRLLPLVKDDRFGGKNELYTQNLEGRDKKNWFEPEIFTRITQVKVDDFLTYEMKPATLMDGFHGEYFGLSDKDAEAESYRHIAQMQKVLGKLGIEGANLQILGE